MTQNEPTQGGPSPATLTCRTFDIWGKSICERPARYIVWGHLFEKRDKGPKCKKHVPVVGLDPLLGARAAIYEIPPGPPVTFAEDPREALARAFAAHHSRTTIYSIDFDHADVALAALTDQSAPGRKAFVVTAWAHARNAEPHPAEPINVWVRPAGGTGAHPLMAECATCREVLLPSTFAVAGGGERA